MSGPSEVLGLVIDLARTLGPAFPLASLVRSSGLGMESLLTPLDTLEAEGVLSLWSDPEGVPSVALSPGVCGKLGIGFPEPAAPQRKKTRTISEADLPCRAWEDGGPHSLDELADPSAVDPYVAAAEGEGATYSDDTGRADYLSDKPPYPRILLGERLQWPVPGQETYLPTVRTGTCAGCRGKRLSPVAYCLVCDRYGWSGRLGSPETRA